MSIAPKLLSSRRVRTGEVRLSYANLFEPRQNTDSAGNPQGAPKYSVALLIPKEDQATVDLINQAIETALQEGTAKFGGKIPPRGALRIPLRDGDTERDDETYRGHWFVNTNNTTAPQVMKLAGGKAVPVTDTNDVYSGAYGSVTVEFFAFNVSGNKGVGASLGNVLKLRDGDPLGSSHSANDDFGDVVEFAGNEFADAGTGGFSGNSGGGLLD